jgi:asparagine synthetase A
MNNKQRVEDIMMMDTERSRTVETLGRKVAENAEKYLEYNGNLEGFDVETKASEILNQPERNKVGHLDVDQWDWKRLVNDVERMTAYYLS